MRAPGIVGTIQLAAVLVLAVPLLYLGVAMVAGGHLTGVLFLAVGGLMVGLSWWLRNPLDPGDVADAAVSRLLGRIR